MKTRLLLASASALALTWGMSAQAENVGIGVLEPQAVLHVRGETANDDDVIFQNMDPYDGTANNENVLLVDEGDGQRVKTIPLTELLSDTTLENSDFSFNTNTNVLSITEGGNTLTVDLSSLEDSFNDTDTTISSVTYADGVITITDSANDTFTVDISAVDTTVINSALTFNDATNVLSIVEGGQTLTADLSDLQDSLQDTNTTIVSFDYDPDANTVTIVDSDFNEFSVDLSELDDVFQDTTVTNTSATLTGTTLTITDSEDDTVSVDLAALDTDTDTTNVSATLAGTTLTITDSADDTVSVDLAAIDTDTDTDTNYDVDDTLTATRTLTMDGNGLILDDGRLQVSTDSILRFGAPGEQSDGVVVRRVNNGADAVDLQVVVGDNGGEADRFVVGRGDSDAGLGENVDIETFVVVGSGRVQLPQYTGTNFEGDAANDSYLTVNADGIVRRVDAPGFVDTNTTNVSATLAGSTLTITDSDDDTVSVDLAALDTDTDTNTTNVSATLAGTTLTITDSDDDTVSVDLAALDTDTDTFVVFGNPSAQAVSGSTTTTYPYTAADGEAGSIVVTDTNTDQGATLTDNEDGTYTFQRQIISGAAVVFPEVVIQTITNDSAALTGSTLTITDSEGDTVSVDLAALDTDTDTNTTNARWNDAHHH